MCFSPDCMSDFLHSVNGCRLDLQYDDRRRIRHDPDASLNRMLNVFRGSGVRRSAAGADDCPFLSQSQALCPVSGGLVFGRPNSETWKDSRKTWRNQLLLTLT